MNRLKEIYKEEIAPALQEELSIGNIMEIPTITKIVINVGVGDALDNLKALDEVVRDLTTISGQHPVVTKAKKSIANFKLREGRTIGAKVTLRGDRMWAFLDRLVNVALPRVRDFRGISADAFDGRGNYTLGVDEQLIFPEINYDDVGILRGMEVSIVTTAETDDQARALLTKIGMPFRKG
ncbi:MAG TPA: 50S ribosomal protein L5 [Brevefilum sp.]|nr:50S ribosomal protein L5 [Brevefilum sp.]HOR19997.1 50S ribosomal protein L5 [Brevefilum sp.]HPL68789.1 50S ribosomal protein L5 [Brevefilum sp.]